MATCRQAAAGGGRWRGAVGQPDNPCLGTNSPVESEYQQLVSRRTVKLACCLPHPGSAEQSGRSWLAARDCTRGALPVLHCSCVVAAIVVQCLPPERVQITVICIESMLGRRALDFNGTFQQNVSVRSVT